MLRWGKEIIAAIVNCEKDKEPKKIPKVEAGYCPKCGKELTDKLSQPNFCLKCDAVVLHYYHSVLLEQEWVKCFLIDPDPDGKENTVRNRILFRSPIRPDIDAITIDDED